MEVRDTKTVCRYRFLATGYLLIAISSVLLFACQTIPRFGIGGTYNGARDEFLKGGAGNMNKAIVALEFVVRKDPTYKDTLTLLGRAYYRRRYEDARQILKRALAVNDKDEIAWINLALIQLRMGQDQKGLETLKGGITLLIKVATNGYRDYPFWDLNGSVRRSIRKTTFLILKGLEEKRKIIRSVENLLIVMDNEEGDLQNEAPSEFRDEHQR